MSLSEHKYLLVGVGVAALGVIAYVQMTGGVAAAAKRAGEAAGEAAVQAVEGAVVGGVNGISKVIGIPTTDQMITDPVEAQAYRDAHGWWAAMGHMSASTYWGTHQ